MQKAIEIIADEGYGRLSMRALARASGMRLGAPQYHFRTWEELLRSLANDSSAEIRQAIDSQSLHDGSTSVAEIAASMPDESAGNGDGLLGDRLWPQLRSMEQVESPCAEALCVMSITEGQALFTGQGRRWEAGRALVRGSILKFIDER